MASSLFQQIDGFLLLSINTNSVVSSSKERFSNSRISDDDKGKSATPNTIALCATDMPTKCFNHAQNTEEHWASCANNVHYIFNSGLRRFYVGDRAKKPVKQAENNQVLRSAA